MARRARAIEAEIVAVGPQQDGEADPARDPAEVALLERLQVAAGDQQVPGHRGEVDPPRDPGHVQRAADRQGLLPRGAASPVEGQGACTGHALAHLREREPRLEVTAAQINSQASKQARPVGCVHSENEHRLRHRNQEAKPRPVSVSRPSSPNASYNSSSSGRLRSASLTRTSACKQHPPPSGRHETRRSSVIRPNRRGRRRRAGGAPSRTSPRPGRGAARRPGAPRRAPHPGAGRAPRPGRRAHGGAAARRHRPGRPRRPSMGHVGHVSISLGMLAGKDWSAAPAAPGAAEPSAPARCRRPGIRWRAPCRAGSPRGGRRASKRAPAIPTAAARGLAESGPSGGVGPGAAGNGCSASPRPSDRIADMPTGADICRHVGCCPRARCRQTRHPP